MKEVGTTRDGQTENMSERIKETKEENALQL